MALTAQQKNQLVCKCYFQALVKLDDVVYYFGQKKGLFNCDKTHKHSLPYTIHSFTYESKVMNTCTRTSIWQRVIENLQLNLFALVQRSFIPKFLDHSIHQRENIPETNWISPVLALSLWRWI